MSSLTTLTVVYYLLQPIDVAGMKGDKYTFQFFEFDVPSHQICHKNGKSGVEFFKKIPAIKGLRYNCKTKWLS